MDRAPFPSRRQRDIAGAVLLVAGAVTAGLAGVIAAFRFDPLAGIAAVGLLAAAAGLALGRE